MKKPTAQEQAAYKKLVKDSENPDKMVATRGYVKCIARHVYYHSHKQDMHVSYSFVVAMFSTFGIAVALLSSHSVNPMFVPEGAFWAMVAVAVATWTSFGDLITTDGETTYQTMEELDAIQKYRPPCSDDDDNDLDCVY